MNIPPFPAQDLAKLVLGYLAEEQLMTAYDEFLSQSPYLDVFKNEYDRIFMTSLKNIVAEYRAVKIYVETCKPYVLRRKLFGCTNLLEIVKFLVQNVDINKIQNCEGKKGSLENQKISEKSIVCALCDSLALVQCICKDTRPTKEQNNVITDNSVETTPLEDLPGSHVTTRRKQVKTLSKDDNRTMVQSVLSSDSSPDVSSDLNYTTHIDDILPDNSQNPTRPRSLNPGSVYSNCSNLTQPSLRDHKDVHNNNSRFYLRTYKKKLQRISTETFQAFAKGIKGGDNLNCNVPDSSTSESVGKQSTACKDISVLGSAGVKNAKPASKAHIFLTVGTINTTPPNTNTQTLQRSKPNESKVTILSDIKVDRFNNDVPKMPAVLNNAASTPLMHMQTILINGKEVYKPQPAVLGSTRHFTKDEIMAMPTIIVAPTSGESQVTATAHAAITTQPTIPVTTRPASAEILQPLTIDVPASSDATRPVDPTVPHNMPLLDQQKETETMAVKTLDAKMVSAPKDVGENKNTPEVLPPLRKSSSTPRRTSHIRVLDFATPRRILQEAIDENVSKDDEVLLEVLYKKSPKLNKQVESTNADGTNKTILTDSSSSVENEIIHRNKKHWDADLRAVAIRNRKEDIPKSLIQPRCRPRQKAVDKNKLTLSNKKGKEKTATKSKKETKTAVDNSSSKKSKKAVCVKKLNEVIVVSEERVVVDDNSNIPVKPTINIINSQDRSDHDNVKNISEPTDTPETDRQSLQNAIDAKLNISDLLETPYKQALYDIQMETPRFLGPDLPGDPMSDIKIMNIPTPRFLDTPKPVTATPAYASRPTDYSSGSSYYRPDDQDYVIHNELGCSASVSKDTGIPNPSNIKLASVEDNSESKTGTNGRPVRKCTKNVSYYQSPHANKTKEMDEQLEIDLTQNTIKINSVLENNRERGSEHKPVKEIILVSKNKNAKEHKNVKEIKPGKEKNTKSRRSSPSKNHKSRKSSPSKNDKSRKSSPKSHKSPVRRETSKTFMKIKPRRATPTKEVNKGKGKKRKEEVRKKTISKETDDDKPLLVRAPAKSRRKSSTPRKLHCTKVFSESSGHDSPDAASKTIDNVNNKPVISVPDSDSEQVRLHWSDEGSLDIKVTEQPTNTSANETEDISKIKEYIASELHNANTIAALSNDHCRNLQVDLVKRGFDVETAKIIERDLLDSPAARRESGGSGLPAESMPTAGTQNEAPLEKSLESDTSLSFKITQDDDDEEEEEIVFTASECHEGNEHYIVCSHEDLKDMPREPAVKLKDKFSMEICIDGDATVRLRATPISTVLDIDPQLPEIQFYDVNETEIAVSSISNIEKLYTPIKDHIRAQVYDIFESTLTSLDTPLKVTSPKITECDTTATEVVLEVEEVKEKPEDKKRKRLPSVESTDSAASLSKKKKSEAEFLINSKNILNIDIETVLSKLHGP